jgi:hypothetical protein
MTAEAGEGLAVLNAAALAARTHDVRKCDA